jgi:diguanylate cyclase (GGDEF)-like protein
MSEELYQRLKASNRLPSPPGVALRVLELARADDASLEDLQKTISSDPALSGKILKFVNSPAAGLGRSTASLDEAVNHIGLRGVQLMALSFSLVSSGKGTAGKSASFDFDRFWSRSLACAVAAKVLSKTMGRIDPNEAFITGLLLHIGQLAVATAIPHHYEEILKQTGDKPQTLLAVEREKLGTTHIDVSAWLLQQWKLPEGIWKALAEVPAAMASDVAGNRLTFACLLRIADVTSALLSDSKAERAGKAAEILALAREHLELGEAGWIEQYDQIVLEWRTYGQLLSVKAGTDKSFGDLVEEAQEQIAALSIATQKENAGIKEQNQQLRQQARIDVLTGIANRASFDERLKAELERATRTQCPLVLCMLDVDHFKRFNDTYGHPIGDRVLHLVASCLRGAIRKMDFLARYGGEEFVVIAPECSLQNSEVLAERLRTSVQAARLTVDGRIVEVTISVGVASAHWPASPRTEAALVQAADAQLYAAKHAGRNCVRIDRPLAKAA